MVRLVAASLIGGLVVFAWGSISWMVLTWHMTSMKPLPEADATFAAIQEKLPDSGVYYYPPMYEEGADEAAAEAWAEKRTGGPYISMLIYSKSGYMEGMPRQFVTGYLLEVVGAGLIACLICLAGPCLQSYGRRVMFACMIAIFATFAGPLMEWNWWEYPDEFATPMVLDGIIGWSLAGLAIAAIMKPQAPVAA